MSITNEELGKSLSLDCDAVIRDASAHGLSATDLQLLRAMFAVGAQSMLNQLMHAMKSPTPLARLHVLREEIELLKVERENR